jgi:hypothetical protein
MITHQSHKASRKLWKLLNRRIATTQDLKSGGKRRKLSYFCTLTIQIHKCGRKCREESYRSIDTVQTNKRRGEAWKLGYLRKTTIQDSESRRKGGWKALEAGILITKEHVKTRRKLRKLFNLCICTG